MASPDALSGTGSALLPPVPLPPRTDRPCSAQRSQEQARIVCCRLTSSAFYPLTPFVRLHPRCILYTSLLDTSLGALFCFCSHPHSCISPAPNLFSLNSTPERAPISTAANSNNHSAISPELFLYHCLQAQKTIPARIPGILSHPIPIVLPVLLAALDGLTQIN